MPLTNTHRRLLPALGLALLLLPGCMIVIGQDDWEAENYKSDSLVFMGWDNGDPDYPDELQRRADQLSERLKRLEREVELMQRHAPSTAPEPAQPSSP